MSRVVSLCLARSGEHALCGSLSSAPGARGMGSYAERSGEVRCKRSRGQCGLLATHTSGPSPPCAGVIPPQCPPSPGGAATGAKCAQVGLPARLGGLRNGHLLLQNEISPGRDEARQQRPIVIGYDYVDCFLLVSLRLSPPVRSRVGSPPIFSAQSPASLREFVLLTRHIPPRGSESRPAVRV